MSAVTRIWRFPDTIDAVWHALTDPLELAAWLLPNDFAPRVGHRFTFREGRALGLPEILHCEVLAVDPPRRLAISWGVRPDAAETVVEFTLRQMGDETEMRIHHHEIVDVAARAGPLPSVWDWSDDLMAALGARLRRTGAQIRKEVKP